MTYTVLLSVFLIVILGLNVAEVINTWRVAQGRSTRRSALFKGRLTPAMRASDRAWQEANKAILPGTVVIALLLVVFIVAGVIMEITWSMPVILLLVLTLSLYNRVVGERAAEKAWMR